MDKQILQDYIDACELIKETEQDIQRLQRKKKTVIQTNVKGSNPEFPYQEQHFKIHGTAFTYTEDGKLRWEEKLLEEQKAAAEEKKRLVEEWMLTVPARMQRIIRFKFFQKKSWEEVAMQMKGKNTENGLKKEFERFMKEN
ncbi:RNA polymerase subunit sigma-70 [Eisenbergiella massiliensis]|uniref:RNA polymerase subunit sigma-70 n=1 Tax=Eisenbergiella massiliensis TaxID=1720294 RepID=UPI00399A36EF